MSKTESNKSLTFRQQFFIAAVPVLLGGLIAFIAKIHEKEAQPTSTTIVTDNRRYNEPVSPEKQPAEANTPGSSIVLNKPMQYAYLTIEHNADEEVLINGEPVAYEAGLKADNMIKVVVGVNYAIKIGNCGPVTVTADHDITISHCK